MTEPELSAEARKALLAEAERSLAFIKRFLGRWPEYRLHLAYGLLGEAVAMVDSYGGDAETFLAHLRAVEPKPDVLVPPTSAIRKH